MAMGKRKQFEQPLFVVASQLQTAAHPFYQAVNELLSKHQFDPFVESLCSKFYEDDSKGGRPSLAPGIYFRCLLIGYFEGIDSERGIDWRCNDSLSLKTFLGIPLDQKAPGSLDHQPHPQAHRL